jgi:hypothetical protein
MAIGQQQRPRMPARPTHSVARQPIATITVIPVSFVLEFWNLPFRENETFGSFWLK